MKKAALLGLALLFGSSASFAAPTSLSTTGSWETATGDLSSLLGQAAPATWTYNTDVSGTLASPQTMTSGGTSYTSFSPNQIIDATAAPSIFDGKHFDLIVFDNFVPDIDFHPASDVMSKISDHGLITSSQMDALVFFTQSITTSTDTLFERFSLAGLMLFDKNFFSGPIVSIPTGELLLQSTLLTYAELRYEKLELIQGNVVQTGEGFANYAESPAAVPVPAAAYLFAPALLGFLGLRRKAKAS